ncbi:hypothetical protein, partial [Clostridium sp. ZBS2]|uniref:hypothetical protein n=1 Tax=Clostridium sp. ZBS2 TaxID=2949976 RepID=UPI0020796F00
KRRGGEKSRVWGWADALKKKEIGKWADASSYRKQSVVKVPSNFLQGGPPFDSMIKSASSKAFQLVK